MTRTARRWIFTVDEASPMITGGVPMCLELPFGIMIAIAAAIVAAVWIFIALKVL